MILIELRSKSACSKGLMFELCAFVKGLHSELGNCFIEKAFAELWRWSSYAWFVEGNLNCRSRVYALT